MNSIFIFSKLFLLYLLFLSVQLGAVVPPRLIVIDPGHGGKDPGASFKGIHEKDITLKIGVLVAQGLQEKLPDIDVKLTRETDVFNHVTEKAEIANAMQGELFISIHVNSANTARRYYKYVNKPYYTKVNGKKVKKYKKTRKYYTVNSYNNKAKGTEVYIWASDRHTNKTNAISSNYSKHSTSSEYLEDIPDLNSPEARLLSQMYAQRFFKSSFRLASLIDDSFSAIGRTTRGVKQRNDKGIWVLQATAMPAVLVEVGYITNQKEAAFMNSDEGQKTLANAIVNAVVTYVENG